MKYTKKMVMVPEVEYLALLNMIKGDDYLKAEKADKETQMSNILRDPRLSEDSKVRKYTWLLKQRRNLQKEIEKPPKIQIDPEQLKNFQESIAKYLGVETTQPQVQITPQKRISKKSKTFHQSAAKSLDHEFLFQSPFQQPVFTNQSQEFMENINEADFPGQQSETLSEKHERPKRTKPKSPEIHLPEMIERGKYIIHPNNYDQLVGILEKNADKLKISKSSGAILDKKSPVKGSNYVDIVDYLTGRRPNKPPGTEMLINRIKKELYFKTALDWAEWYRQHGDGKRRRRQYIKHTKGLVRVKKPAFKPIIWEHI